MKLLVVKVHMKLVLLRVWHVSHEIAGLRVGFRQPLSHQILHFLSHQFTSL
nr:MAG TPA: hypothetical protein [Caudoviricetes sp.]